MFKCFPTLAKHTCKCVIITIKNGWHFKRGPLAAQVKMLVSCAGADDSVYVFQNVRESQRPIAKTAGRSG